MLSALSRPRGSPQHGHAGERRYPESLIFKGRKKATGPWRTPGRRLCVWDGESFVAVAGGVGQRSPSSPWHRSPKAPCLNPQQARCPFITTPPPLARSCRRTPVSRVFEFKEREKAAGPWRTPGRRLCVWRVRSFVAAFCAVAGSQESNSNLMRFPPAQSCRRTPVSRVFDFKEREKATGPSRAPGRRLCVWGGESFVAGTGRIS
ncbi:hypothetical protein F0521_03870 [Ferrimonas sp. YFM]|nr:hypothetical protein F0521_03870 [Ferrimonas sp. YFM]